MTTGAAAEQPAFMGRYGKGANKYGAKPEEYLAYKRYAHLLAYKHYMTELFEPLTENFFDPYPEYARRVQDILKAIQKTLQASSAGDLEDGGESLDRNLVKIEADIGKLYADLRTSSISLPPAVIADKSKIHDKASNIFDSFVIGKSWRNHGKLKPHEDILKIIDTELGLTEERKKFLGKTAKLMAHADMLRTAVSNIHKVSEDRLRRRLISKESLQELQQAAQAISGNLQKAYAELSKAEIARGGSRRKDNEVATANPYIESVERGLIRLLELTRSTGIMEAHPDDDIGKFVRDNIAREADEIAYGKLYPSAAGRAVDQKDDIRTDISQAGAALDKLNLEISDISPAVVTDREMAVASAAVEAVAPKIRASTSSGKADDREMEAASAAVEAAASAMARDETHMPVPTASEPAFMARYADGARHGAKYRVNDNRYLFLKKVAGVQGLADVFDEVRRAMARKTVTPELQAKAKLISDNLNKAYDALLRAEQAKSNGAEANASLRTVEGEMQSFVRRAKDEGLVPHLKSSKIADTAHERARKYFAELVPTAPSRAVSEKENITHDIEKSKEELHRNSEGIRTRERFDSDDDRFEAHAAPRPMAATRLPITSSSESIAEDMPILPLTITSAELESAEKQIARAGGLRRTNHEIAMDVAIDQLSRRMIAKAASLAKEIAVITASSAEDLKAGKVGDIGREVWEKMNETSLADKFKRKSKKEKEADLETRKPEAMAYVIDLEIRRMIGEIFTKDYCQEHFGRELTTKEIDTICDTVRDPFIDHMQQLNRDKNKSAIVIWREEARVSLNRFFRNVFVKLGLMNADIDISTDRSYNRSNKLREQDLMGALKTVGSDVAKSLSGSSTKSSTGLFSELRSGIKRRITGR